MSPDEITYLAVLLFSVVIGFLFKHAGPPVKQWGGAAVGLLLTLGTCNIHILHSIITILGTWLITKLLPRSCHFLALGWTFTYLLFFRTVTYFDLPAPTPFTNAVQLLLTLKLVSLANEVQEFNRVKKQEVASFSSQSSVNMIPKIPSLTEVFLYSYCYIGLMTEFIEGFGDRGCIPWPLGGGHKAKEHLLLLPGYAPPADTKLTSFVNKHRGGPFYRFKTYHDWLHQIGSQDIPSWKPMLTRLKPAPVFGILFLIVSHYFPLEYVKQEEFYQCCFLYRLFYMVPIFFVFRMRFYVAWIFAECGCIAAAFGAYPVAAKSRSGGGPTVDYALVERDASGTKVNTEYDYETVKNIDCYGADFCVKVKDGMRCWNMSVQWWLAQYIYKNSPVKSFVFGSAWTMLISAYWHGIHPGYYLSFLTIPLCLASEVAMDVGLRRRLSDSGKLVFDWVHWFLKMRAYDYMCMGFVLLTFSDTVSYWRSIYFTIHVVALFFLIVGRVLAMTASRVPQNSKEEKQEIKRKND